MTIAMEWLRDRCDADDAVIHGSDIPTISSKPWRVDIDGRTLVVATDMYGLVMAEDKELAQGLDTIPEAHMRSLERYLNKEPRGNPVSLANLKAWLGPVKPVATCEECKGVGRVKCGRCDGEGTQECECHCGHEHEASCYDCDGSGDVECRGCVGRQRDYGIIDGRFYDRALLARLVEPFEDESVRLHAADHMAEVYGDGWKAMLMRIDPGFVAAEQSSFTEFETGNDVDRPVSFKAVSP